MRRWIKRLKQLPIIACTGALLLAYASCFIHPAQYGYFMVFGLFYPIILIISIIVVIAYLFVKPKYAIILLLAIGAGLKWWPSYFSIGETAKSPEDAIHIASYNAQGFVERNSAGIYEFAEEAAMEFSNNQDIKTIDLITLQESPIHNYDQFVEMLDKKYTSTHRRPRLSVYSHQDLEIVDSFHAENKTNGFLHLYWNLPTDTVEVISVHLQSNKIKNKDLNEMSQNSWTQKSKYRSFLHSMRAYKEHAVQRADQVVMILERISKTSNPVIVLGDFNDVPMSYVSERMRLRLKDAYAEAGTGLSSTLRSVSGLKIDYIYVSEDITVHTSNVIRTGVSDHYPIMAAISL